MIIIIITRTQTHTHKHIYFSFVAIQRIEEMKKKQHGARYIYVPLYRIWILINVIIKMCFNNNKKGKSENLYIF